MRDSAMAANVPDMLSINLSKTLCLVGVVGWLAGAAPAHAIVNGKDAPDTPEARATVYVGGCSGTLVAADLVLTAGHCVDRGEPPPGEERFRGSEPDWERPDRFYRLPWSRTITVGPRPESRAFTTRANEYALPGLADMILLRLIDPVPGEIAPLVPILTHVANPSSWLRGKTFEVAGFGDDEDPSTSVHLNEGAADRAVFPCPRDADGWAFGGPHKVCVESADGSGTRPGDSGGPLYWRNAAGKRVLVGVFQGPERSNAGRYTTTFYRGGSNGDDGRSLSNLGGWLEQHVNSAAGGPAYLLSTVPSQDHEAYPIYASNPTGLQAHVRHMGRGLYRGYFEGLRGNRAAIVTAYGDDTAYCKLSDASRSVRVGVRCYDHSGVASDSLFSLLTDDSAGDVLARVPAITSNGTSIHGPVTVTRSTPGVYVVRRSTPDSGWRNVLVSAEGIDAVRCHVRDYTETDATIGCVRPDGARADSGFSFAATNSGTHVDAAAPTMTRYDAATGAIAGSTARPVVERTQRGKYRVSFPGLPAALGGNVQVTAVTATSRYCKPRSWTADSLFVACFDQAGQPADTRFMARYVDTLDRGRRVRIALDEIRLTGGDACMGMDLSGTLRFVAGASGAVTIPYEPDRWLRLFSPPLTLTAITEPGTREVDVELVVHDVHCGVSGFQVDIAPSLSQRVLKLRLDLQAHTVETLGSTPPVLGTFGHWWSDGNDAAANGKVRLLVSAD